MKEFRLKSSKVMMVETTGDPVGCSATINGIPIEPGEYETEAGDVIVVDRKSKVVAVYAKKFEGKWDRSMKDGTNKNYRVTNNPEWVQMYTAKFKVPPKNPEMSPSRK